MTSDGTVAMTIAFDTKQISPDDRAELIRDTIWNTVVKVNITHVDDPSRIRATGRIRNLGRISICSVRSNATTIQRTARLARDDLEPSLFLGLQISGSSMVIQDGRQATLEPGDLALYDTTKPYTLLNDNGIHQHFFRIPREHLALPIDTITAITAIRFGHDHPVASIASSYFAQLAHEQAVLDDRSADTLDRPSIELLRAMIASRSQREHLIVDTMRDTLVLRILEYARTHLADPNLTAARLAAEHHISIRQLYTVLARADICLGDWIRTQRLERCRQELAAPAARHRTIAAIARRWAFKDATHFSRAFRDAYGMSPREWRTVNLR